MEERGERSQSTIASEIGITKSSWAMYERNERIPRDEVKIRIAEYFGKTVQEIFFGHNEHIQCIKKTCYGRGIGGEEYGEKEKINA